jgi:hypothetical protein
LDSNSLSCRFMYEDTPASARSAPEAGSASICRRRQVSRSVLALLAVLASCGGPAPGVHGDEALQQADVRQKEADIMKVKPTDTTLELERHVGIKDCYLPGARVKQLEQIGWSLVRCDQDYAVAETEDRIGRDYDASLKRQSALLSVFQRSRAADFLTEKMRASARHGITGEPKQALMKRFNVSSERDEIFVTGLVDQSLTVHGTISFAISPENSCEFVAPDMPFPQTRCTVVAGKYLIQLRSNSTDFEALQGALASIIQMGWSE